MIYRREKNKVINIGSGLDAYFAIKSQSTKNK
jgi:hypothetical protein